MKLRLKNMAYLKQEKNVSNIICKIIIGHKNKKG